MRKVITLTLSALFAIGAFAAPTGWKILKEIKIGGEGGWDYLTMDSAARRLYVSHNTHVVVVDPDAGKVVGDIPDTPGVHGIALVPELNKGFVSNGRGNNVTIFDIVSSGKLPPHSPRASTLMLVRNKTLTSQAMTQNRLGSTTLGAIRRAARA